MRYDARALFFSMAAALAMVGGCGDPGNGGPLLELTGGEMHRRLPEEVANFVADDAILCLDETRSDGTYRLWILRRPGGTWMAIPARFSGRRLAETHEMPPSALLSILRSRLPSMATGIPRGPRCRFTHWRSADGAEIQVRELITDQGWFASVERVAM